MKLSATILLSTFFLAAPVYSCLIVTGSTNVAQFTSSIDITAKDDGRETCKGHIGSSKGNVKCIAGYSLWAHDIEAGGRIQVKYKTPHGSWDFTIDKDCDNWSCGGKFPVECYICSFARRQFGC